MCEREGSDCERRGGCASERERVRARESEYERKRVSASVRERSGVFPARNDARPVLGPILATAGILGPRMPAVSRAFPDHRLAHLDGRPLRSAADR